jgi:hypothetical protein
MFSNWSVTAFICSNGFRSAVIKSSSLQYICAAPDGMFPPGDTGEAQSAMAKKPGYVPIR